MSSNQLQVETKGNQLIMTRRFNAPREKVFRAHTACEHLKNWWGPREWPLTYCKIDFRVGGQYHYCMTGPDGTESWGLSIYKEIKAPELIAYEDHFSDKDGNKNTTFPSTTVRTEFIEEDGKTLIKSVANYASPEDLKKVIDMGMEGGMAETMDRLDEYVAEMK
jgi:uncharacterized protein YndB with AHSA1/START domain